MSLPFARSWAGSRTVAVPGHQQECATALPRVIDASTAHLAQAPEAWIIKPTNCLSLHATHSPR